MHVGIFLYSGETILYFLGNSYTFSINPVFWIILATILFIVRVSIKVLGLLIAGTKMVLRCFTYMVLV